MRPSRHHGTAVFVREPREGLAETADLSIDRRESLRELADQRRIENVLSRGAPMYPGSGLAADMAAKLLDQPDNRESIAANRGGQFSFIGGKTSGFRSDRCGCCRRDHALAALSTRKRDFSANQGIEPRVVTEERCH